MSTSPEVSVALVRLLGGPCHAEDHPDSWATVTTHGAQLRDHLNVLGLRLVIDDTEQYAYLRTHDELPEGMPRLIRRHSLTFGATILLILLRQRLTTAETDGAMPRLILTGDEMVEMLTLYNRDSVTRERVNGDITSIEKLGYLRKLRGSDDTWEVRRIIKAIVTSEWIANYGQQLLDSVAPETANNDPAPETAALTDVDQALAGEGDTL